MVIARTWHATATTEGAAAYHEHFTHSVLPDLQRIDGFQGAYLLRHDHDGGSDLQVLTLWDSLEAIRGFASADVECAVVEPAAQAVLPPMTLPSPTTPWWSTPSAPTPTPDSE